MIPYILMTEIGRYILYNHFFVAAAQKYKNTSLLMWQMCVTIWYDFVLKT